MRIRILDEDRTLHAISSLLCLTSDTTTLKAAVRPHVFAIVVAIGTELPKTFAECDAVFVSATCKENVNEP